MTVPASRMWRRESSGVNGRKRRCVRHYYHARAWCRQAGRGSQHPAACDQPPELPFRPSPPLDACGTFSVRATHGGHGPDLHRERGGPGTVRRGTARLVPVGKLRALATGGPASTIRQWKCRRSVTRVSYQRGRHAVLADIPIGDLSSRSCPPDGRGNTRPEVSPLTCSWTPRTCCIRGRSCCTRHCWCAAPGSRSVGPPCRILPTA